nr:extracellular solute-binding protein [uncultured Acetatifactor sp.]
MRHGKGIAAALCAAILAGALGGCGKQDTKDGGLEQQKGRWVETQEELPEELEDWTLQNIFSTAGEIHLLASRQEGGKTLFSEWAGKEDGFADVTEGWLASLELDCGEWFEVQLMQSGSGTQYLYAGYVADGEEDFKGHLWKGQGEQIWDITPAKWTVLNEEWGMYEWPLGLAAQKDGTLTTLSYLSVDVLSGTDGSVLSSEPLSGQYEKPLVSDGENVYLCASGSSGIQVEKRGSNPETISLPAGAAEGVNLCAAADGTLVTAGGEGIFRRRAGESDWEKLLNGSETDLALAGCWCIGLAMLESDDIYALYRESEGGGKLNRYAYDPEAVIEVTQELKLYTVFDSSLLQQAAVLYHKEHPEVLITIESAYPAYYDDETDYNAVYQSLNTMLMGDDAPDILVMDHLDMDSFTEKGLLVDIGEVVNPLEESGELLPGITGAYVREDGHRYVVPLQFGFTMALGRDIGEADMASLEALAQFLSGAQDSYLGPQTVSELVDKFYPYFCGDIVKEKRLDKETLAGKLECLKKIADNCGMVDSREKGERAYNMWNLASQAKLAFSEADGFKNCMFPIAMAEHIKGSFMAYENSFVPTLQTGICAKSPYQDTAMDFLRLALSGSIQDTDYYRGFPVNRASLEKQVHEDRSEAEAETSIETDDGEAVFIIRDYSEETADRLLALCQALDKPVKEDEKIREVLIEALDGYLKGSQSQEDTVQKIEDGLKMYLAE